MVQIYEVAHQDGHIFIAMELVEGRTLRAWVNAEEPPWREIVERYIQAGRGLEAAHAADVLHRDFKPDNVLIGRDGRVRVLDFGLARPGNEHESLDSDTGEMTSLSPFTISGSVMGTPRYMPPEQHDGEPLTPAADQYAFCASLWGALTDEPAFRGSKMRELAAAKRRGPPQWPPGVNVPRPIVSALRRGLQPFVENRWPSMGAMLAALERGLDRRRRNRVALAGFGLAIVGSSTAAASLSDEPASCTGAREQLGDAWDEQRREATEAAFEAVDATYAAAAWDRASAAVDEYADAWVEQHNESCEATRVRGDQSAALMDLRVACLHAARRELAAVTQLLSRADAKTVERADDLVRGLPALSRCADGEALLAGVEPPSASQAAGVAQLRDAVAKATALGRAGKYAEADEVLTAASEDATDVDYEPARAELAYELGRLRERQGRYDEAEAADTDALLAALRTGQWDLATDAAIALVMVAGSFQGDLDRGLAFATTAWGLIGRSSRPMAKEASLRRILGSVYAKASQIEPALQEQREALRLTLADPVAHELDVAHVRHSLGVTLLQAGKYEESERALSEVLELRTEQLGADHPSTTHAVVNLASLYEKQHKLTKARELHTAALEAMTRTLGPRHPKVGVVRANLSNVLYLDDQIDASLEEGKAALEIFEEAYHPSHPNVIGMRVNLAGRIGEAGRHEEAVAQLKRLIDVIGDTPSNASGTAYLSLGFELGKLDRIEEALVAARRGTEIWEQIYGPDHPDVKRGRAEIERLESRL